MRWKFPEMQVFVCVRGLAVRRSGAAHGVVLDSIPEKALLAPLQTLFIHFQLGVPTQIIFCLGKQDSTAISIMICYPEADNKFYSSFVHVRGLHFLNDLWNLLGTSWLCSIIISFDIQMMCFGMSVVRHKFKEYVPTYMYLYVESRLAEHEPHPGSHLF